jgi:hypothetical protein
MKNKLKIDFCLVILAIFLNMGCSFLKTQAESQRTEDTHNEVKNDETGKTNEEKNTEQTQQIFAEEKNKTDIGSVIGTYDYDTEKDGEGYDNSLEITLADDGKLFINISGSYIYKVGETQSMHEAEGRGDAVLRGNRADATLVDEEGKPCRATIIFQKGTAEVKIPETCQFNVAFDGIYKKTGSAKKQKEVEQSSDSAEISYEKVMDFVNDFEAHKIGEEFIIKNVPAEIVSKQNKADQFGNKSYKDLYFLEGVTDDNTPSYSFLTSKAMIESLRKNVEHEPINLRMTAVIVESRGKFDVYRMPFITKIEALGDHEKIMWEAEGTKPLKLNFVH